MESDRFLHPPGAKNSILKNDCLLTESHVTISPFTSEVYFQFIVDIATNTQIPESR